MDSYSQLLLMQQYMLNLTCPGEKTLQRPNRAVCEIDSTIPYDIYTLIYIEVIGAL
jgi:hypothetical protein